MFVYAWQGETEQMMFSRLSRSLAKLGIASSSLRGAEQGAAVKRSVNGIQPAADSPNHPYGRIKQGPTLVMVAYGLVWFSVSGELERQLSQYNFWCATWELQFRFLAFFLFLVWFWLLFLRQCKGLYTCNSMLRGPDRHIPGVQWSATNLAKWISDSGKVPVSHRVEG